MVAALVEAGQLLQGVADADFEHVGRDRRTAATDELGEFLLELGHAVCRSWDSRFQSVGPLPRLNVGDDWPGQVELRVPEGFAFYALFPEAYAEAARRLALSGPPRVIGIRSIGTSLGAIAAAALGAPPPVTVRPFGDPFARKIAVDPALEAELLAGERPLCHRRRRPRPVRKLVRSGRRLAAGARGSAGENCPSAESRWTAGTGGDGGTPSLVGQGEAAGRRFRRALAQTHRKLVRHVARAA